MSKYKVGFYVNSRANICSTNAEVIDLVDDYGYTEEKAEEIINDEEKLKEEFKEWLWDTIEVGFQFLETEKEVEDWKRMDQWLRWNTQNQNWKWNKIAKMYVTYRDEMIDSFSSSCLEKVVEYLISKEYVISNHFDTTEMQGQ